MDCLLRLLDKAIADAVDGCKGFRSAPTLAPCPCTDPSDGRGFSMTKSNPTGSQSNVPTGPGFAL